MPSADFSAPDELVQFQFDVSGAGVEVSSGDIYIVVNEAGSGFLGISNDTEPQSPKIMIVTGLLPMELHGPQSLMS